jgi:hypothetical protein
MGRGTSGLSWIAWSEGRGGDGGVRIWAAWRQKPLTETALNEQRENAAFKRLASGVSHSEHDVSILTSVVI